MIITIGACICLKIFGRPKSYISYNMDYEYNYAFLLEIPPHIKNEFQLLV